MKKKIRYKVVDTVGQLTAIITDKINMGALAKTAKTIMGNNLSIEQVGYLDGSRFVMMGDELSINGLLAAAYLVKGARKVNGIPFVCEDNQVSLKLPNTIIKSVSEQIVRLDGMTYQLCDTPPSSRVISSNTKQLLNSLALSSPASGIIYYNGVSIMPLIFVKATNSYVWENACGSGSLAFALVTSVTQVEQPSGQIIEFQFTKSNITVTAAVKEI